MRSSIACIRCRRSKVKCLNNGVGTTCRSCENSGRECTYPPPVPTGSRRRDSPPGKPDGAADGERRQRPRKVTHTLAANPSIGLRESPRPLLDALDPRVLTPQVWQELFDIFQVHYAADLPFLHPPTFLKPLRQASMQPPPTSAMLSEATAAARPPGSPDFLLAFLALTARYHLRLVAHHSPATATRPSNPLIASEYYAAAANERLATSFTDNQVNDLERTQAMLMLGLHEWGMCRGAKAWILVGMAIRAAQAMGLQYELDLDDEPLSKSLALNTEAERMGLDAGRRDSADSPKTGQDAFVQQEVRRRTFWSCFIMDRYLSSGKYRPQMLHAQELRIQLPASERSFMFAEKVRTLMLGEEESRATSGKLSNGALHDGDDRDRLEAGADEGLVSRYVRILEVYGRVMRWSCAGGRRIERLPPWDPQCEWHKLRQLCLDFRASLPRQHTLTPQNTQAHISLKTSTPYTLIHTVYLLCLVMLHRQYVPFLPIQCSRPEGPLDQPTFPPERYDIPPGFWDESARELFKAARGIMDLVRSCQEWNALVETPIVGFAIYTVAFVGSYCINFPWMDPDGYLCTQPRPDGLMQSYGDDSRPGGGKGFEAARRALEIIGQMRPRLRMADGWFATINRMHKYLRRMKSDYRKNIHNLEPSSSGNEAGSTRRLSLREGGVGGGLDEWRLLERTLVEFGKLEDQDVEMTDAGLMPGARNADALYENSSAGTTTKSEEGEQQASAEGGPWTAINATNGVQANGQTSASTPSSAQFRSYESFPSQYSTAPHQQALVAHVQQQQQQQASNHPPLLNSFRPTFAKESSAYAGGPPSMASPASHTVTTSSHGSPVHERHPSAAYGGWTPQNNSSYHIPTPNSGYSVSNSANQQPTPLHPGSAYPTPQQSYYQSQQHLHPASLLQEAVAPPLAHRPWSEYQKAAWMTNLQTSIGSDDIAVFTDGSTIADWVSREDGNGHPGWLNQIFGGTGTPHY
ncbi:hypothetical protein BAUCODRAFT_300390 [Baudoinia panamericana UAMH 10762]|uniref:Zn(2)-C6 fungal-type domain-containing protein n=1 Tax=Baudoinia panamericana (strain UAMH 10762) TaxID=717646 RepID=M2M4W9_BAUPA|nr:uncharacterized protein BAUCODRAFT_300390 [Baudoinia panamericana UAMH 10762]EMC91656.1 hypothetical protein BAUCODRAFT_300390 [Baudoinia panamericana UAMH 10762]